MIINEKDEGLRDIVIQDDIEGARTAARPLGIVAESRDKTKTEIMLRSRNSRDAVVGVSEDTYEGDRGASNTSLVASAKEQG